MTTSLPTRIRLFAFSLAMMAALALIAWAAGTSWMQFEELSDHIHKEELGSFDIADAFQANLLGLNYTLVRFGTHETEAERLRFEQQSAGLNHWLDQRKAVLTTPRERAVLADIDHAYDLFLTSAQQVITTAASSDDRRLVLDALEKAAQASQPLLDLGTALATANRDAGRQWRGEIRDSIRRLQWVIVGSLAGLVTLGAASSAFVYQQLIAPLRSEIAEGRELMARQEKLASLGVLAAGVAHEIRNPLTAIKLRLYTLRQELSEQTIIEEDTDVIAAEIERLEHIVSDFLQFARPAEPKLESLKADRIPAEVQKLVAGELASRGIDLKLDVSTEAEIRADPRQLKQVLLNLVRNAADSISSSGIVTLAVYLMPSALFGRQEPCVFIDVQDTGVGIPPGIQKRLFDPFFSTKETGTGLGLSIAARIIEAHGGQLRFRTEPGAGTTFSIILPQHPS